MKYIVEIPDEDSHSFKVALYLLHKLKDALANNSESFWHVLGDGSIAVNAGRCYAYKFASGDIDSAGHKIYNGWCVYL